MADNLFANYEQDFRDVYSSIENHLRTIPNLTSPDQKLNEIKKTAQDITDAEDILQSMNLNARNVAGPQGQKLTLKIREYEGKVQSAKKDLRRMETTVTSIQDREELMGGAILSSELNASLDQRERLLTGTDRLHKSNQTLLDARRTAESTVETGANILSNLESQRETMQRSMGRLDDINAKLSQSSRILTAMARRVATNKLIMAVIILVLLGAIVLIAWLKFRK